MTAMRGVGEWLALADRPASGITTDQEMRTGGGQEKALDLLKAPDDRSKELAALEEPPESIRTTGF